MKSLYIAEKPSVAQEFGRALHENLQRRDGFLESDRSIVTWCVGHLVTMSYPEKYDEKFRRWSFDTLPFLPEKFQYEVLEPVRKQFGIVSGLLNREDVETIYVCTDSGREGEYIYRLVAMMAEVGDKKQKRVWIDSQTEEEIRRGIREAKDLSEYDALSASAFLRAKEDYLMGINFSRALSLKYSNIVSGYLGRNYQPIAVGRVMTCVLGMVVRREREIRNFKKTPFYRVMGLLSYGGRSFEGEWRAVEGSRFYGSPKLYKENGFARREDAEELAAGLGQVSPQEMILDKAEKKTTKKNPPLLYNLAEIQNDCSKKFKISPDQTLSIIQDLYERKLVTYPRTDARVLSSAIAKQIDKNIRGLLSYPAAADYARLILDEGSWKGIGGTRYTNDKQITDHYAIIPTGQGMAALGRLAPLPQKVYDLIVRRFLSIFFPPAVYQKVSLISKIDGEAFFSTFTVLTEEGYLAVVRDQGGDKAPGGDGRQERMEGGSSGTSAAGGEAGEDQSADPDFLDALSRLRKGARLPVGGYEIKEGETSPPKRYTSGSMILAMENAGQLIEDDDLREQIKGSGIGTSATRAEILKKLEKIKYLSLNKKTQVITPTQLGEMIYDVVFSSIRSLLNPELTASWEKGLTYVAEGSIGPDEYMEKLERFVAGHTRQVREIRNQSLLHRQFDSIAPLYRKAASPEAKRGKRPTGQSLEKRKKASADSKSESRKDREKQRIDKEN